jgi:CxxC motif-containing protein
MNAKELVCTVCPNSCSLIVELSADGQAAKVSGNRCSRGEIFAKQEVVCPMRILTSSVLIHGENGTEALLPVRSSDSFALSKHAEAMELLRHMTVKAPVKMGDVIIRNLLDMQVNLIASSNS